MNFASKFQKRIADAFQFVLDDLTDANAHLKSALSLNTLARHLISALTMLALDDVADSEIIVDIIIGHILSVRIVLIIECSKFFSISIASNR